MEDSNVEAVREKLLQRSRVGIGKYKATTDRDDLSRAQWLEHAQEEAMDFAVYLQRLIHDQASVPERLREASREALVALAVLKSTDEAMAYTEIGEPLRQQISKAHDMLLSALRERSS